MVSGVKMTTSTLPHLDNILVDEGLAKGRELVSRLVNALELHFVERCLGRISGGVVPKGIPEGC